MLYPYAEALLEFERRHGARVHANRPENLQAAVIVETRPLFFLPHVIKSTMFALGEGWNLHVLCGLHSFEFVRRALAGWTVAIVNMGFEALSTAHYSVLLKALPFWQQLRESKILIFQSDTLVCSRNIDEFKEYDYIGAPCGTDGADFVINGGLSLRTRDKMTECIRSQPPDETAEDIFFSRGLRRLGAKLPSFDTACRFAVESVYIAHPFGVHGTDKTYQSVELAERIARGIRW
jgi:hypothetical protein